MEGILDMIIDLFLFIPRKFTKIFYFVLGAVAGSVGYGPDSIHGLLDTLWHGILHTIFGPSGPNFHL